MYEADLLRNGFVLLGTLKEYMCVSDGYCTYVPIYPSTDFEHSIKVPDGWKLFYNTQHACYAILAHNMLVKPLFESKIYQTNKALSKWNAEARARKWKLG